MLSKLSSLLFDEKNRNKTWSYLCLIVLASLYIGLIFPYRGEEGLYPATSFEMLFNHHYGSVYFLGGYYGRPPMFNWLMLTVAHVIGYQHMLLAARFVSITLTIGCAGLLYWLSQNLTHDKSFSLFSVLCYLSGDLLFRSSWIAYADPTFTFFIFASICFMWMGVQRNQQRWLLLAIPALIAAFLSKALTCYAFYGVTALVILFQEKKWRFFFHPISIVLHLIALAFPLVWFSYIAEQSSQRTLWDLFHNFSNQFHLLHYLWKLLGDTITYVLRFAPLSLIVIYVLCSKKFKKPELGYPSWLKIIALSSFINFLPYWLTPGVYQIRYLFPLFPFVALMFAYVLTHTTEKIFRISLGTLVFFIAMKLILSPFGLPWFEHMSYQYNPTAREIMQLTKGYPLYVNGIDTLIATLDQMGYPKPPVIAPNNNDSKKAFFLAGPIPIPGNYQLVKSYRITDNQFALYCYNAACNSPMLKGKNE